MSVLEVCGVITLIGGAIGILYKGYKEIMKPADEMNEKLNNDYKNINDLKEKLDEQEREISELKEGLGICLEAIYQLLEHGKTGNNTGGMQKSQDKIFKFLNY